MARSKTSELNKPVGFGDVAVVFSQPRHYGKEAGPDGTCPAPQQDALVTEYAETLNVLLDPLCVQSLLRSLTRDSISSSTVTGGSRQAFRPSSGRLTQLARWITIILAMVVACQAAENDGRSCASNREIDGEHYLESKQRFTSMLLFEAQLPYFVSSRHCPECGI